MQSGSSKKEDGASCEGENFLLYLDHSVYSLLAKPFVIVFGKHCVCCCVRQATCRCACLCVNNTQVRYVFVIQVLPRFRIRFPFPNCFLTLPDVCWSSWVSLQVGCSSCGQRHEHPQGTLFHFLCSSVNGITRVLKRFELKGFAMTSSVNSYGVRSELPTGIGICR